MTHEWKQKWRDVWLLPTVIEVIVACLGDDPHVQSFQMDGSQS
jgi:hypothetical protein